MQRDASANLIIFMSNSCSVNLPDQEGPITQLLLNIPLGVKWNWVRQVGATTATVNPQLDQQNDCC